MIIFWFFEPVFQLLEGGRSTSTEKCALSLDGKLSADGHDQTIRVPRCELRNYKNGENNSS